jgi:hypothetical protein
MRTIRLPGLIFAVVLAALYAAPAQAQASRTWISGVGDDYNPCSRTAPCKTFAGAISKTAAGGEIDCLDPGGFGAVTITKSITFDCAGGVGGQVGSILASGTNGVNISAGAGDRVKLRNLTINGFNGSGIAGIKFNTGASLTIEHVGIFGFGASSGAGVDFDPQAAGSALVMRDVEVQNNNAGGVKVTPVGAVAATASLENVALVGNGGNGLVVGDGGSATVRKSMLSHNTMRGVYATSSGGALSVNLVDCAISENPTEGIRSSGAGSIVRIASDSIFGNGTGLKPVTSGQILSFGNNYNAGNGTDGAPTGAIGQQ